MRHSTSEIESLWHRLRQRFNRLRDKSQDPLNDTSIHLPQHPQADRSLASNPASISQYATLPPSSLPLNPPSDVPRELTNTGNGEIQLQTNQSTPHWNILERKLTPSYDMSSFIASSDLWSAAYREAVESLGEEIDIATLKRKNVARLFRELEDIEKEVTNESAFTRGVRYLHSLQVPLEKFKLALDLALPLTAFEPTATTVVGVVRIVTAIAITFATADLDFAKQIGDMLDQISYIDDCDLLGQKTDRKDIHKALVSVYQKILEFYKAAFEILTRKGAKLLVKMVLDNGRLPNIVQDFLACSENLRKLVQKATWEVVEDIKSMLYDREIARWLGSDKMTRQSHYHADWQELRADQACEFLLKNTQLVNWYHTSDSQQLVILGDMGCGKTVAMSFLVDELLRRNEHQLPQPKICYYYCRDDETGKAVSIISALILSLLEQLPGLKKRFFEWYKQAQVSGIYDPAANIGKLEQFLQKLLEEVDRPVFVVIDGLDECDRASRNRLLQLLKTLSQKLSGFKTILSCRPQEEILEQLNEATWMELGYDSQRDRIIAERAVERQLSYLSTIVKALVIDTLSRLAQGCAIWTKMIIGLVEVRRIREIDPMRRFLAEMPLPTRLSELYVTLLSRCTLNDPENQEMAITALKLIAVTRRPLSILELAWAVALSTAQAAHRVTTVDALAKLVDHQRVIGLIHPFIARIDFRDVKKRQVRLVHQSVKEFILKEYTSDQPCLRGPAQREIDQMVFDQRSEDLEAFILDICVKYLLVDDMASRDLFSDRQVAIAELPQESDLFNDNEQLVEYDPYCTWESWEEDMIRFDPTERGFGELFVYASCHWLEHFGSITVKPLPSLASIENLCQAGSTRLSNWIQQNCRPGCTMTPRFQFDSSLYDPLSITSLYGSVAMLRDMLENSNFDSNKFLREPAMEAADQILQWGDVRRLKILFFDGQLGHQLQSLDFFRLIIKRWYNPGISRRNCDIVFDLVDGVSDKLVREQWGNELLCVAAGAGCMPIIRRLITSAQHKAELRRELLCQSRFEQEWSRFGKSMHQSVGEAVLGNHVDVVEFLLEQNDIESHLRYRNSRGENVLHLASRLCNPEMFRRLVPRFPDGILQADDQGDTALVRVIMSSSHSRNRYESARIMLLQRGVDLNGHSWDGQQNPLRAAVQLGDLDMCCLLICVGNINPLSALACDSEGQMDLNGRNTESGEDMLNALADLFDVKEALSTGNSAQFVSSITEEAIRYLAE